MHKLINTQKEKTIRNNSSYGPVFGCGKDGADLAVCDQSNSSKSSFSNIGNSYCKDARYHAGRFPSL
jgi:hypothetical protein